MTSRKMTEEKNDNKLPTITPENFHHVRRDVEIHLQQQYARLGTAIVTEKEHEFSRDFKHASPNADPGEKMAIAQLNKAISYDMQQYHFNKAKAMGTLHKFLSKTAMDRVRSHQDYYNVVNQGEPVQLWTIIKESLQKLPGNEQVQNSAERARLIKLVQAKGEKVEDFASRFLEQVRVCEAIGMRFQEVGEDVEIFINNIDQGRYRYFFDHVYDKPKQERTFDWVRSLAVEAESRDIIEAARRVSHTLRVENKDKGPVDEDVSGSLVGFTQKVRVSGKKHQKNRNNEVDEHQDDRKIKKGKQQDKFCKICRALDTPSVVYQSHNPDQCRYKKMFDENHQAKQNGKRSFSGYLSLNNTKPNEETDEEQDYSNTNRVIC